MLVPQITHLQFLVLSVLLDRELSGKDVREKLAAAGEPKSGPAFYQFMSRLEESGYVKGWYDEKVVHGQRIKERMYRITGEGARSYRDAVDFYAAHSIGSRGSLGLA